MADPCPVCASRALFPKEVFEVQTSLGRTIFDLETASQIVSDGREAFAIPNELAARLLAINQHWSVEHLPHVDRTKPGIIGQRFGAAILMDGIHRLVRSIGEGGELFRAYVMTAEETDACEIASETPGRTAEQVAAELREVLRNNPEWELFEIDLEGFNQAGEAAIRQHLTVEENRRVKLRIAHVQETA
jgi:hypothetical protein